MGAAEARPASQGGRPEPVRPAEAKAEPVTRVNPYAKAEPEPTSAVPSFAAAPAEPVKPAEPEAAKPSPKVEEKPGSPEPEALRGRGRRASPTRPQPPPKSGKPSIAIPEASSSWNAFSRPAAPAERPARGGPSRRGRAGGPEAIAEEAVEEEDGEDRDGDTVERKLPPPMVKVMEGTRRYHPPDCP